jgi:hypothetical protein
MTTIIEFPSQHKGEPWDSFQKRIVAYNKQIQSTGNSIYSTRTKTAIHIDIQRPPQPDKLHKVIPSTGSIGHTQPARKRKVIVDDDEDDENNVPVITPVATPVLIDNVRYPDVPPAKFTDGRLTYMCFSDQWENGTGESAYCLCAEEEMEDEDDDGNDQWSSEFVDRVLSLLGSGNFQNRLSLPSSIDYSYHPHRLITDYLFTSKYLNAGQGKPVKAKKRVTWAF